MSKKALPPVSPILVDHNRAARDAQIRARFRKRVPLQALSDDYELPVAYLRQHILGLPKKLR
jgi:hypothetical protein